MTSPRAHHTATLLPDGQILVVGSNITGTATADLYDPTTGTFAATGSLPAGAGTATATLLNTGKVLLAGGGTASAELYDPSTGTFISTGSMTISRTAETATLLPNGQVLVAGGYSINPPVGSLSSAELYDPTTGTWTPTGSMPLNPAFHTATLLSTGQVLVAGGCQIFFRGNCLPQSAAELYDPGSGTWSFTGNMSITRYLQTATLLANGQVLVAGGFTGTNCQCSATSSAEVYDPASGTWAPTGAMVSARTGHTATLLPDGTVLATGGSDANFNVLSSAEVYNPTTGLWSLTGSMATARAYHTATLLTTGQVLVAGGYNSTTGYLASAEVYTPGPGPLVRFDPSGLTFMHQLIGAPSAPQTITITNSGSLPLNVGAVTITGANPNDFSPSTTCTAAPLAPGGQCSIAVSFIPTAGGTRNATVTISDDAPNSPQQVATTGLGVVANTWIGTGKLTTARYSQTATLLPNGKVLVAGGGICVTPCAIKNAELYDPSTGTWAATGNLTTARIFHTATLLPNGTVLAAGGCANNNPSNGECISPLAGAELYNPSTGTWTATGSMATARSYHTASLLPNGTVLVAGGSDSSGNGIAGAEVYDPGTGTWAATGAMPGGRYDHTATSLANGMVLVAGGCSHFGRSSCVALAGTALYNPSTATWTAGGSMSIPRYSHTATLLPSGQVLVAGGQNCPNGFCTSLTDAELYNPSTGTWSGTGAMTVSRFGHTATLLPSGQVLVAAGASYICCSGPGSSAELYDPATGAWSATGSLTDYRVNHTATLLPNGIVLVAGGVGTCCIDALDSSELYTPGSGPLARLAPNALTFGNLQVGSSAAQTVTVINSGSVSMTVSGVAITGTNTANFAETDTCTGASLAPAGRCTIAVRFMPTAAGAYNASVTITDTAPSSPQSAPLSGYGTGPNAWAPTGSMSTTRAQQAAALLSDGTVLVLGGSTDVCCPLKSIGLTSAEIYHPSTGTWSSTGHMAAARLDPTATVLSSGKVLVAGGTCPIFNCPPLSSAELYDPATGTWTPTGSMTVARQSHTATLLPNGKVLVTGGCSDAACHTLLAGAELYNPTTGTWAATGSMSTARDFHTATLLANGKVLVAGGCCDHSKNGLVGAELYDPATGTWTPTGSLVTGRQQHTATRLPNGQVLVAGGCADFSCVVTVAAAELYNPKTGTWTATGSMATAAFAHTATLLTTGQVLVAGGASGSGTSLAGAELYDPSSGTWAATATMSSARAYHTATLLPNGQVLVAGGGICGGGCTESGAELYTPALLAASPASGAVGQTVKVAGSNFYAAEPVAVYWDSTGGSPLAMATTGASGAFVARVTIPAATVGTHTLIAIGGHSGAVARAAFRVTP